MIGTTIHSYTMLPLNKKGYINNYHCTEDERLLLYGEGISVVSEKRRAIIKIVFAMIIVGSSVVAGKLLVDFFPVFLASEIRFLIASVILVPLLIRSEGLPRLNKKELGILFLQSFCGVFLFSIFMLYGLMYTTATEGGIITSTLPAVVAVLAFMLLKEKPTRRIVTGIFLAVFGTVVINSYGSYTDVERGIAPYIGNMLIIGAVIGEALFIILGKSLAQRVSPLAISTFVCLFGVVLFLPFAIYEAWTFSFSEVTFAAWGILIYFGLVVTVLSFVLMYQGIEKVSASTAGILTSVLPISAVGLSAIFLKEQLQGFHIVGMILILLAIYFISNESKSEMKQDTRKRPKTS